MAWSPRASRPDSVMDERVPYHLGEVLRETKSTPCFNRTNERSMLMKDMPAVVKGVPQPKDGIL